MPGAELAEIPVLYRDEHLVAVHKPAGLLVHRNSHAGREPVLLQTLRDQLGQRLYPVHRLDRPTSGVMIMAFSSQTAHLLALQFAGQEVGKAYLAVTRGFTPLQGLIDDPIKSDSGNLQEAQTEFTRLATAEIPHPIGPNPTATSPTSVTLSSATYCAATVARTASSANISECTASCWPAWNSPSATPKTTIP
jgi:tRNA pseudouridine65 synthase